MSFAEYKCLEMVFSDITTMVFAYIYIDLIILLKVYDLNEPY